MVVFGPLWGVFCIPLPPVCSTTASYENFFPEVQPHAPRLLGPDTHLALISSLASRKGHGGRAEDPDGSGQRCCHQGWWLLPGRTVLVSQVKRPFQSHALPFPGPRMILTKVSIWSLGAPWRLFGHKVQARNRQTQPHSWISRNKARPMLPVQVNIPPELFLLFRYLNTAALPTLCLSWGRAELNGFSHMCLHVWIWFYYEPTCPECTYLFIFPHNEGKICFYLLEQSCPPSISINSILCHSQRWPEVDNKLYRCVGKGPFPKEICFAVCLGQREVARELKVNPIAQWEMKRARCTDNWPFIPLIPSSSWQFKKVPACGNVNEPGLKS